MIYVFDHEEPWAREGYYTLVMTDGSHFSMYVDDQGFHIFHHVNIIIDRDPTTESRKKIVATLDAFPVKGQEINIPD